MYNKLFIVFLGREMEFRRRMCWEVIRGVAGVDRKCLDDLIFEFFVLKIY